ncbi:hypothetical protein L596_001781 [Steinernema carpocapsae]|uniref:Uncharacterized protein n=1 Tax=Steinernema carpocapsae TaxID=34508 RepID=A0A4U8UMS1_STECR|nr:hypothetical protein L596_001781 [Steinernema carpocapsae]
MECFNKQIFNGLVETTGILEIQPFFSFLEKDSSQKFYKSSFETGESADRIFRSLYVDKLSWNMVRKLLKNFFKELLGQRSANVKLFVATLKTRRMVCKASGVKVHEVPWVSLERSQERRLSN